MRETEVRSSNMQGDINKWKYSEIILLFGSLKKMEKRNQNTFFFFLSFEKLVQQHLRWSYKNRIAAKAWHKLSWLKFIFQNNTVNEKKSFLFLFLFSSSLWPSPSLSWSLPPPWKLPLYSDRTPLSPPLYHFSLFSSLIYFVDIIK